MNSRRNGFIMVEVMAAIIIILTGVLSVAACYNFGVSLMVHNNYKQEAFKLAQETMVSLRKKEKIEKSDLLHGRFHIRCEKMAVGFNPNNNLLFVEVYLEETQPLVNLVGYE
ncbi:MAG: hypothetical protein VB014_01625 [Acidaminococcaceae bacterium]|nr:hypothetical protein [Acidaminococcaceae bacterium]